MYLAFFFLPFVIFYTQISVQSLENTNFLKDVKFSASFTKYLSLSCYPNFKKAVEKIKKGTKKQKAKWMEKKENKSI